MKGEFCLASVLLLLAVTVSGQVEDTEVHEEEKYTRTRQYENTHAGKWNIYSNDNNQTYYIPFIVQSLEGYNYMTELMEAFEDYNEYTCLQFRERTDESIYVTMRFVEEIPGHPQMCGRSTLGMNQVENQIWFKVGSAECNEKMVYVMRHELFHLVGLHHEHDRSERDDHVIDTHNDGERHAQVTNTDISAFDFFSVSNYYHFHDKSTNLPLGNKYGRLSSYDIKGINKAYKCVDRLLVGGCYNANLPTIHGAGRLSSNNSVYQTMEGVRVICDPGYEVISTQFSYCEDGSFVPHTLRCRKISCDDKTSKCAQLMDRNICDATQFPAKICQQTCGFCDSACWTTPLLKGMVKPQRFNKFYLENDTISIECQEGYFPITGNSATCSGGEFDIHELQCVRIIEGTVDERRVEENVENRCEPLDIEVGNGMLVPVKEFYENGDVIQLVCNDGFEPSSTSTAYCRSYGNSTGFHHAKLQCVARTCGDESTHCETFKKHDMCNRTEMIGASRIYCRESCGHCGLCKSMPRFDRDISSLSSEKMEYKRDEQVEIKCFKGYRPMDTSTSTCTDGVFDPPQLLCVPDETSCISPPNIIETHSIHPRLQLYPSGLQVDIQCGSVEHGNFGYNVGKVTCFDGKFEPFSCASGPTCTMLELERFIENLEECDGREYSYSPIDEIYLNNSEVDVYCGSDDEIFVYCQNGSFVQPPDIASEYEYEDSGSGSGSGSGEGGYYDDIYDEDYFIVTRTDQPCLVDDIDIYGEVEIPYKDLYEHGEPISCAAHPEVHATCSNGHFSAKRLICYEDDCADDSDYCSTTSCADAYLQENCRLTCGLCERPPCYTPNKELRGRVVSPYHDWFRYGEVGEIVCENYKRIPITCGDKGKFDQDLFDSHLCTIARTCENSFEFCSIFHDECHKIYLRRYCPGTCKGICGDRSLSSRHRSSYISA